ncbi:MAG: hypothetical protein H6Q67_1209 [Firmicutes bacterium]|nr:hypothetical protein [Bacillota bacterium]
MVAFDDLPGKGKAQQLADRRFIPPEQRAAFLALRNSGSLPLEMELRKEIASLEEPLQIAMEEDKPGIIKAITEKKMFCGCAPVDVRGVGGAGKGWEESNKERAVGYVKYP